MNLPHHRMTIRERSTEEMKARSDFFKHCLLTALFFATLILTGVISG